MTSTLNLELSIYLSVLVSGSIWNFHIVTWSSKTIRRDSGHLPQSLSNLASNSWGKSFHMRWCASWPQSLICDSLAWLGNTGRILGNKPIFLFEKRVRHTTACCKLHAIDDFFNCSTPEPLLGLAGIFWRLCHLLIIRWAIRAFHFETRFVPTFFTVFLAVLDLHFVLATCLEMQAKSDGFNGGIFVFLIQCTTVSTRYFYVESNRAGPRHLVHLGDSGTSQGSNAPCVAPNPLLLVLRTLWLARPLWASHACLTPLFPHCLCSQCKS